MPAHHPGEDHASHHHSAGEHSAPSAAQKDGTGSDHSKLCCTSITCTAAGIVIGAPEAIFAPTARTVSVALLDDMLRAFNSAAIDPPPR